MHDTGALFAFFPELKSIEFQVIRDFYHRYTVDEHTMVAMENLLKPGRPVRRFLAESAERRRARVRYPVSRLGQRAEPEAGHVDGSVRLAEAAMSRLGMPAADRETVHFLIAKHLVLSEAISTRDLSRSADHSGRPRQMQTVERLKALTLLTYADISAVNPTAMTPWRAEQLWQLYLARL